MNSCKAVADGSDPAQRRAAVDAARVQDAVNLVAIVNAWQRHLAAMHEAGISGDELNNHPVNLAFISKLNSLCRMNFDREMAALGVIDQIKEGEPVEYDVIPL